MKEYRKLIIATTLITLLPILLGLILWNRLPDTVAVHWGADGQADGWAGKAYAVFGLPCLLAAIHLFAVLFTLNDPRRKNINKKPLMLVFWLIPVLSLVTNGIVYLTAMGADIDVFVICFVLIGIVFIVFGNYMPKLQQNYTVGIKMPWTLNSTENWNRTHRLGGRLFIVGGILMILGGFSGGVLGEEGSLILVFGIILLCAVIPCIYSFWLFRRGI
ncbi:MAG TPA: SdpI family protein [Candidatus Mediterraneibacter caccogallinarum]|nr:SdpI family protein [Candidatus Mediterraneibacter caccogallinarum]